MENLPTAADPSVPPSSQELTGHPLPETPRSRLPFGVRLTIYIATAVFLTATLSLIPLELNRVSFFRSPFPWLMFLQEALLFAAAFLPALLLARLERRSVGDYGLPLRGFLSVRFLQGGVLGIAEISLLMSCISLFGGYTFGGLALSGVGILEWLLFWSVFFVAVGLYEEFVFRGYLQFTLTTKIGFWPAAWILSLSFGALHRLNSGENWVGSAGVAAAGLVFALVLQRTGNLWFAVGWHAAFDFGETFLFSVPNSGIVLNGHLSNASLHGPAWLTGGSVGPEGSVFSFLILGLSALLIHLIFPESKYLAVRGLKPSPETLLQRTSSETNTN